MRSFRISLIQMQVEADKAANLARAEEQIEIAAGGGAELVVLPEMFNCPYEVETFAGFAEQISDGPSSRFLSQCAARFGVYLAGGSIPERDGGKLYNTATLWGRNGQLLLTQRKLHLFDVDIPGGIQFRESETLTAGDRIRVVSTELATIGLGICFDLRFPEHFRAMVLSGAELFILPGAFNTTTGPAHWEPLARVRAIENTCFLAACSPAPHPRGGYPAWGHSMIIDPFGEILASCQREPAMVTADLDAGRLAEVRKGLPVLRQRRPDLY